MAKKLIFLFLLFTFFSRVTLQAADEGSVNYGEKLDQLRAEIADDEARLKDLKSQEATLKNQLSYYDNRLALTTAKIAESEMVLDAKEKELIQLTDIIEVLKGRIIRLGDSLIFQTKVFGERARASYKNSRQDFFSIVFGGAGLSDAVSRYKYLRVLEVNDQKLLTQMKMTRESYKDQKVSLEEKKVQVELLKKQIETDKVRLVAQKEELSHQKEEKGYLLSVTQADEKKYQDLLNKSRAEKKAIEDAISSMVLQAGVSVKAGDPIALMGNSGYPNCSTGAHLHFEVRKDGAVQDPSGYLAAVNLQYDEQVGRLNPGGSWRWPLSDTIIISQEYGMSFWARTGFYNGSPHSGIDMYNNNDYVIRAPADGTLYKSSSACGKSTLKYAAIDHGGGVMSYYLHIQ